jgi:sugar phosphate isomerase/epimerase
MQRRELLQALAAIGLLPRFGRRTDRLERIGIQLYTVRDLVAKDFEGTLTALRAIGFREVEFAGYPKGLTGPEVAAMLGRVGLTGPSAHLGMSEIRDRWEATLDFARAVGHRYLAVASVPAPDRDSAEAYRRLGGELTRAGEAAKAKGIQLCYHNHDVEFARFDGRLAYDLLLESTDPELVKFELDVYWMIHGGEDPVAYFSRWPGRFPLLHLKDMDRTPARDFTELGRGRIDFTRILVGSKQGGARHYFYEQDRTPGDPLASARVSYSYLESLRF